MISLLVAAQRANQTPLCQLVEKERPLGQRDRTSMPHGMAMGVGPKQDEAIDGMPFA